MKVLLQALRHKIPGDWDTGPVEAFNPVDALTPDASAPPAAGGGGEATEQPATSGDAADFDSQLLKSFPVLGSGPDPDELYWDGNEVEGPDDLEDDLDEDSRAAAKGPQKKVLTRTQRTLQRKMARIQRKKGK